MDFLEAELERRGLGEKVSVAATGCQAHCDSGPTMVVYPGPIYYQAIDQARLVRITEQHLSGGEPVTEYFWSGVRRRILADGSVIFPKNVIMPERPDASSVQGDQPRKPKPKKNVPEVDDFKW